MLRGWALHDSARLSLHRNLIQFVLELSFRLCSSFCRYSRVFLIRSFLLSVKEMYLDRF